MRLTTVILLASLLQVSAATFGQRITLNQQNISLKSALREITKQSGYGFYYDGKVIGDNQKVNVMLSNAELDEALKSLFTGLSLTYHIDGKIISIRKIEKSTSTNNIVTQLQRLDIRGKVTDSLGSIMVGASVYNRRINKVAITDDKGLFSIDADPGDELSVSYIGYVSQLIKVTDQTPFLNIVLLYASNELKEVIINTGYQKLSKERATGAFSKPDMNTFNNYTGTMDIVTRLQGQIPGLTISTDQAGNSTNVLRGISTVNLDSEPLYVVNGIIVSNFNSVNINDIEDVAVLKDAAAAAIYGSRASNGVIVVTTKSGKKNQKLTVNYSGFFNYQGKPNLNYIPVMTSQQYIQTAKELFDPVANSYGSLAYQRILPHEQILYDQYNGLISAAQANSKLDSLGAINNRAQVLDLAYRPAYTTNHTVSVSGGNEVYSFYSSLGYTGGQNSTVAGNKQNDYKVNLTQNLNLGSRINVSLNTSLINAVGKSGNNLNAGARALPYQLLRDASGQNIKMNYAVGWSEPVRLDYQQRSRINLDYTPLDELDYASNNTNNTSINVTSNVNVKLLQGLSFNGTYGYIKNFGQNDLYYDNRMLAQRQQILSLTIAPTVNDVPQYLIPTTGGTLNGTKVNQKNWTVRNQLQYEIEPFNKRDRLSIQIGQEAQENSSVNESSQLFGYDQQLGTSAVLDYAKLSQGVFGTVTGYGGLYLNNRIEKPLSRFTSWFGLASYTFDGKYSIDGSWRKDKSNLFGSRISMQNKPVWSIGGKWNLHKEAFFAPVKWVDQLALRATYGITGLSPNVGSSYQFDVLYPLPQSQSGGIAGDALVLSSPGNRSLTWERSQTINVGVDFAVLNNRISGSIDLYRKKTTNLLGFTRINPFSGFNGVSGNLGEYLNKGIEISLNTLNIKTKDFEWRSLFVFGYNKNKLKEFQELTGYNATGDAKLNTSYYPGYASSALFAYDYAGLDNMGDPQIRLADGTITKDPYYQTAAEDIKYMGTTQPVFNGGFTNTFRYKAITLGLNMVYSLGNVMRRDVNDLYVGRQFVFNPLNSGNLDPQFLDRWKKPGDESRTDIPRYLPDYSTASRRNTNYYAFADKNVVSASYIKLREITLGYNLPASVLQALKIQKINVFAQATNFMLWRANEYNIDPESFNLAYGVRVVPPYRHTYAVGVNITL